MILKHNENEESKFGGMETRVANKLVLRNVNDGGKHTRRHAAREKLPDY